MKNEHFARLVLMTQVSCKAKHRQRIQEAAKSGKCIIPDCKSAMKCRGLCIMHANEFFGSKRSMSAADWKLLEKRNIEAGLVLPAQEQRRLTKKSVFITEAG